MCQESLPVERETWKLYVAAASWPLYLFTLPLVASWLGWWTVAWMMFPGIWLFCWLGVLMHETAHRYFPNADNELFYRIFSLMLCLDPQIFKTTHATHHKVVNTYDDLQIHPLGKIHSRFWRAVYNTSEILLGDMHFWTMAPIGLSRHPRLKSHYRLHKAVMWNAVWILGLIAIGSLASIAFDVSPLVVLGLYVATVWMSAVVLRHNEMIQHANLIVEGTREQRNLATRNLLARGVAAKVFLFLTHEDLRQHVLHHTEPTTYVRPFPDRRPMPTGAVYITMGQYLGVLGRMMIGKTDYVEFAASDTYRGNAAEPLIMESGQLEANMAMQ